MQQAADFQDVLPLNTVILRVFMGSRGDQTSTYREITVKATKPKQDQEIPRSENTQWLEEYLGEICSILVRWLLLLATEE